MKEKSDKPHAKTGASHVVVKKFIVQNKLGLHARPAALFVQAVAKFESEVHVQKGKQKVNGKSIMGLMMLAAGSGSQVTIEIKGPDAEAAMAVVDRLFSSSFGEE